MTENESARPRLLTGRVYWLLVALVLSAALSFANYWAVGNSIYWLYPYSDLPMHFFGGVTSGVFLIAFFGKFRPRLFLAAMVLVAVGWEIFEYVFNIPNEKANYALDTQIDLLMDTLGAAFVYAIARLTLWKTK